MRMLSISIIALFVSLYKLVTADEFVGNSKPNDHSGTNALGNGGVFLRDDVSHRDILDSRD